ncbi:AAA family ATPase [Alkalibaculum sp. M08DMB]|uniref:AAA family ATPase n=1 Tax=Alkalibaculum sporogenes TaxID=2655001 RepID=A0A6A7KBP0_9FIRM|nr:AAA family ATPase [Alkalibaculum sporogenes]MPW26433.1 AAA family ATPase [Alkalibaculum sporogenes]
MYIKCVEIQNFRKLKSCRIEFTEETTLFVGANNSGKTSAMDALVKFLIRSNQFTIMDFTLSNWSVINNIGMKWESNYSENISLESSIDEWKDILPTMDVWLQVEENEIHYVTHLIPTLSWKGGLLGVRLRLEPKDIDTLLYDYCISRAKAKKTISDAQIDHGEDPIALELWPRNMRDFLDKTLLTHFTIRAYLLDDSKYRTVSNHIVTPQDLSNENEPLDKDPFKGLILIHNIDAQRGFSDPDRKNDLSESNVTSNKNVGMLSSQLRTYYSKHLNPTIAPNSKDIGALDAIERAQKSFDENLKKGFEEAILELSKLGYPGFSDPKITISTKIRPIDSLNHNSAVQFELMSENPENNTVPLRLPEQYNGLGYQNLISMVFKLMQFRDEWMQVGKLEESLKSDSSYLIPPLHLVLIEEPEAHLHIQVQQVFIKKAYDILRNHENLKENNNFTTQMVVSTHSSSIAHEMNFSCLRYFRRIAVIKEGEVPTTNIINLSEVFGQKNKEDKIGETNRFVSRYIKSTHCDLFFADAAILIEGPAERMLIPHFIRHNFVKLNQSYISLLEIGGSHAHRLKPLIESLGITTLIITDLDCKDPSTGKKVQPSKNKGLESRNTTLRSWIPGESSIDKLLNLNSDDKVKKSDDFFNIRVAYQYPINIKLDKNTTVDALSNTFEDALVFSNLDTFKKLEGNGLIKKFNDVINKSTKVTELEDSFFNILKSSNTNKGEFSLDLLYLEDPETLNIPNYIHEGLTWLQEQLETKKECVIKHSLQKIQIPVTEGI